MIITIDGNIPSKLAHSFNVMKMAQGFRDVGQEVEVVSLLSWPIVKEIRAVKNIHAHYGVSDDIDIKLLPVWNFDFFRKSIQARGFDERFYQYIKKKKPNFVYCRSFKAVIRAVEAGVPAILETHTTNYEHPDLNSIYQLADKPAFVGLVTIHENIKREHVRRGVPESKIMVLEDGVNLDEHNIQDDKMHWRRQLNMAENKKIVLYSGSLYKEKGIQDILETAGTIEDPQIQFVIVGGEEQQVEQWKQYCATRAIPRVIFKGFVPNALVPAYLKSADVLLMPYPKMNGYQVMDINSTSPLKLFEFIASNRPVVSSAIPVIEKIITHGDDALLVRPGDIDGLQRAVTWLLEHPVEAATLASSAREKVKAFTWKGRCEQIIDYYQLK